MHVEEGEREEDEVRKQSEMHVEEGEREENDCDMGQGVEKEAQDTDFDEETNTEYVHLLQHKHPTDPGLVQKYDIKSKVISSLPLKKDHADII